MYFHASLIWEANAIIDDRRLIPTCKPFWKSRCPFNTWPMAMPLSILAQIVPLVSRCSSIYPHIFSLSISFSHRLPFFCSSCPPPQQSSQYAIAPVDEAMMIAASKEEKTKEEVLKTIKKFVEDVIDDKVEVRICWQMDLRRICH